MVRWKRSLRTGMAWDGGDDDVGMMTGGRTGRQPEYLRVRLTPDEPPSTPPPRPQRREGALGG